MGEEQEFERTEPATPRRREKFREKGQVAKSREVSGVVMFIGVLVYFHFAGEAIFDNLSKFWTSNLALALNGDLNLKKMQEIFEINIEIFFFLLAPFFLIVAITAFAGTVIQTGWLFTVKPLMPDLNRVDPIAKFKQLFLSSRLFSETGINLLKLTVLVTVIYMIIAGKMEEIPRLAMIPPAASSKIIIDTILEILLINIIFFFVVAAIDYYYQWYTQEKKMKMTKQEIKDEFKDTEGDPHVKGQMRSRMREISMNKLIDTVPDADMILVNPTHIAIALKYKPGEDRAPKVVAKGKGFWAERIKEIATQHNIEIIQDKLLARTLYKSSKVGMEIPSALYRAVAELLAYVFSLKQHPHLRSQIKKPKPFAPDVTG